MAKRKKTPIVEKVPPKHIIVNGLPLPEWRKLSKKEQDSIRKKRRKDQ